MAAQFASSHWYESKVSLLLAITPPHSHHPYHTIMVILTPAPEEAPEAGSPEKKKKSKLTTQQDATRRLIEYCVIVSSVRKQTDTDDNNQADVSTDYSEEDVVYDDYEFTPVITARYPLTDHADNPLHESTTFFCHPSGISLRSEPSMPKVSDGQTSI